MIVPPFQTSRLLENAGFRHAFFTRHGGISSGPFASLNFSATTGDTAENFNTNLELAAQALGVTPGQLFFISQVHGIEVRVVGARDDAAAARSLVGDSVMSRDANLACAVRTADCVPVLLADPSSGDVVAVHAGWRGVALGAITAGVAALRRQTGATSSALIAAIGPHISASAFEVSPEVARELQVASPDPDVIEMGPAGKPHVNLRRIVTAQLQASGLARANIDQVAGCTFTEADLYFSYRRDGTHSGRLLSAIVSRTASV